MPLELRQIAAFSRLPDLQPSGQRAQRRINRRGGLAGRWRLRWGERRRRRERQRGGAGGRQRWVSATACSKVSRDPYKPAAGCRSCLRLRPTAPAPYTRRWRAGSASNHLHRHPAQSSDRARLAAAGELRRLLWLSMRSRTGSPACPLKRHARCESAVVSVSCCGVQLSRTRCGAGSPIAIAVAKGGVRLGATGVGVAVQAAKHSTSSIRTNKRRMGDLVMDQCDELNLKARMCAKRTWVREMKTPELPLVFS